MNCSSISNALRGLSIDLDNTYEGKTITQSIVDDIVARSANVVLLEFIKSQIKG